MFILDWPKPNPNTEVFPCCHKKVSLFYRAAVLCWLRAHLPLRNCVFLTHGNIFNAPSLIKCSIMLQLFPHILTTRLWLRLHRFVKHHRPCRFVGWRFSNSNSSLSPLYDLMRASSSPIRLTRDNSEDAETGTPLSRIIDSARLKQLKYR